MSTKRKGTAGARKSATTTGNVPAAPYGPGYAIGQRIAQSMFSETPWEHLHDAIKGFRESLRNELNERGQKIKETERQIDAALNALEA